MSEAYWREVHSTGLAVPTDRPLGDLTIELTRMLGDPDPDVRSGLAVPALSTWIQRGVYDDLLGGLGDGMAAGLVVGLGDSGNNGVFRRASSVEALAECIARDNARSLVRAEKVLEWGDRIATWLLRERDLRAFVPERGWAHAVARGADALGTLAASEHLGKPELTVILDVVADRVLARGDTIYAHGEPDRLAAATMSVLRRNLVPLNIMEPWINRIVTVATATPETPDRDPFLLTGNAEAFLRALYIQLALSNDIPQIRGDLLLVVVAALKKSNATYLT
ncbi:DUF2785 domain-containing protein [Nocardioides sp. NPDC101246]|uniref:DUF2785 domain-containing protein n=2 Tax=Nocardioides TaxID=1839 RepID=UPI0008811C72|nr:DUF2785 domain-containing protein [Nocardioides sp. YR527]SDK99792.1 Protein of unknown function [Nocardioides sp. YR527]